MPPPRTDPPRIPEEKPRETPAEAQASTEAAAPAAPAKSWPGWLPLVAALVLMPAVAYVFTTFFLVPRMQKTLRATGVVAEAPAKAEGASGEGGQPVRPGQHQTATLNKILVNVAGTMGSRYLLTSLTLVGDGSDFSGKVLEKEAQLRDTASGLLMAKTIADLEKPGARNQLRGELLAGFNSIMGNTAVLEIYFTEFAIQ